MAKRALYDQILSFMTAQQLAGRTRHTRAEIAEKLSQSPSTTLRYLTRLKIDGKVKQSGQTSASVWELVSYPVPSRANTVVAEPSSGYGPQCISPYWSAASTELITALRQPLGARTPSTYQQEFVESYQPNKTFLLSESLADELFQAGRLVGQQPAGTYARNVISPLLIDFSFSSSKLEGNRYTKLDTEILFESGKADPLDTDALMLLNHKRAIEFLINEIPLHGLSLMVVRNIHELLMQGLLCDEDGLGTIRQKIVRIGDTVYVPTQIPALLETMLQSIVDKASLIKNPIEAAFFLWINIAYLQPFEDGNKRTSRITANVPLLIYNCAPLSFLDVSQSDYCLAMVGIYEQRNLSVATDLFVWTYRRSIQKYAAQIKAAGVPNPFRNKHRELICVLVAQVVEDRQTLKKVMEDVGLSPDDKSRLLALIKLDLARVGEHNFARYRLRHNKVMQWIEDGRPVIT